MIINTGNRTDIPAYYSQWFYNRIKEGYVLVRNPYYPNMVTRYLLDPSVVDCIAFCTKNPEPMLAQLDLIRKFGQFWIVTINAYGKDIEPRVPTIRDAVASFRELSEKVGKKAVRWRYDPIIITDKYSLEFHIRNFENIADKLSGYTEHCIISFVDLYDKVKRNFPELREVSEVERKITGKQFYDICKDRGMTLHTCAEGDELAYLGIDCSGCQTKEAIEEAIGCPIKVPASVKTRKECDCLLGNDIGAYSTCLHGCRYCYANEDTDTAKFNFRRHNPNSPFLIGDFFDGDIIKSAEQESWKQRQITLDLSQYF